MSDLKKFEEMLERLINEDKEGAEELFHEIVVEKSREIYESLLEDDLSDEEVDEASEDDDDAVDESQDDDEDVEEASEDDDEQVDEEFDLDEFEVEADPMAAMGGDPADNMMGDVEVDGGDMDMDMGDEEGEGDIEDRVMDLEDALDDLKAEFDKLMSGEEGDDEEGDDEEGDDEEGGMDMDMDMGDDGDDAEKEAFAFEAKKDYKKDDKKKDMKKSAAEEMREYVEKVGGATYNQFGKMGDNGTNTKSPVAGKNDMGGTASNLVQGKDNESGDHKGFAGLTAKEDNAGNVNVPGAKGATSMKGTSGHGAEKKGKSPERSGSDSPINGVKSRAK